MNACPIPDWGTGAHTEIMEDRSQAAGRLTARGGMVIAFSRAQALYCLQVSRNIRPPIGFPRDGPLERAQLLERSDASRDIDGADGRWPMTWAPRHG
jgi:hypothetical protein